MLGVSLPFLILLFILLFNTIKIIKEYERAVVFRLGRFTGVRGPGLIFLVPGIEKMVRVDLELSLWMSHLKILSPAIT